MNKNVKRMFFVLTLVTLLVSVSAVCATYDTNSSTATDSSVSDSATVSVDDSITTEAVITTSNDNLIDTKTLEKEDKNNKKDSKIIDNITYNIHENEDIEDYSEYYGNILFENCTFKDIEDVSISGGHVYFNNSVFNNVYGSIFIYNGNVTINNSKITESTIGGNHILTFYMENNEIDSLSTLKFNRGYIGDYYKLYDGYTFNSPISIKTPAYIKNSIINSTLIGNGINILTIGENVSFTDNAVIKNFLKINSNNTQVLLYINEYNDTYTIENCTLVSTKSNFGNLTITNSIINNISNIGQLNLINCTLNGTLSNRGVLNIDNNIITTENFKYNGVGIGIINGNKNLLNIIDENKIFENEEITNDLTIDTEGNITFNNCTLQKNITNYGNIIIINSTINSNINNYKNLIINDTQIHNQIINNGNLNLTKCSLSNNNMTTTGSKTDGFLLNNKGNATLVNCIMENNTFNTTTQTTSILLLGAIVNQGQLNLINSSFNNNSIGYTEVTGESGYGVAIGMGAVVANNATLIIDNSIFTNNYAGSRGGAISSTKDNPDTLIGSNRGNVTITNSIFKNNTAGTNGGAIYLYNTTTLINSTNFTDNQVYLKINQFNTGGGAIKSEYPLTNITLTIDNCNFDNNSALYDGMDLMGVSGSGGAISTYYVDTNIYNTNFTSNHADSNTITIGNSGNDRVSSVNITGCRFLNNTQGIKIGTYKNTTINNNTFINNNNHTQLINIQNYNFYAANYPTTTTTITNNNFIDNNITEETIYILKPENATMKENNYINTTINDTINLTVPNKIYTGEPITITGIYNINNPENYDTDILEQNKYNIYINGVLNQTIDTLEFIVTPTAGNMIVTVQPTISQTRKTVSIKATTLTNITITPENYNEYIYEGQLIGVGQNSKITFQGQFNDKGEIYIDTSDIILTGQDATFTNTQFVLDAENIVLQNMKINNTETTYPIANYKDNNIISNNTITLTNTQTTTSAIYNTASNTLIENNTITMTAPAGSIDFSNGQGVATTQAILLLGGNQNTIQNNNINIKCTQASGYNTLEAITNSNGATNTLITQNNITLSGANFNYAIDSLNNVENITVTSNIINVNGERYCDGLQVGNNARNILVDNNNITCVCINTTELTSEGAITYGVIGTNMGSESTINMTITNNNINLTGTANYGIELYWVNNTQIHNNNITVNGPFSMGIGYAYSPNGNATQNNITINGDSTTPINMITEEFKPENVGIRIQNGTTNITLTENTITTSDIGGQDSTIHTEPNNVTIANNKLISSTGYGDETIKAPTTANIENNTIQTTTIITIPETIITNTQINITATVNDEFENPLNTGTITFTKNDETLATATVINGTATATVTFTQEENTTITATYTPTSTGLTTSSAEATVSIQKPVTQLNIEEVNLTADETVTLTAKVTDQIGNNITGGKVTFKVNGKTVKDANGKVIYAKVTNGIATAEYAVPDNMNGKNITITAVYSGTSKYNKETTSITSTVTKSTPTLKAEDINTTVGSTITLKATITDNDKVINTGKIVFKINGKTVKDENGKVIYAKVVNNTVTVEYTLPEDMKAKDYTITATFISPDYDKITDEKTLTVN